MIYLDSSAFVKKYVQEKGTDFVDGLMNFLDLHVKMCYTYFTWMLTGKRRSL